MNVCVIVVRGLQTSALGCYGNEWLATPHIDRLAAAGVVFDQHFADAADPVGARRAWRSGRYWLPGDATAEMPPTAPEADLLALLQAHGTATTLIPGGARDGFPDFEVGWGQVIEVENVDEDSTLERTLEAAIECLDRWTEGDDWLLWLDLDVLLPPWEVPDEYLAPFFSEDEEDEDEGDDEAADDEDDSDAEDDSEDEEATAPLPLLDPTPGLIAADDDATFLRLRQSYAAAVAYLDAGVGLLLDELDERGLTADTAIVFMADCGLPLGEHREVGNVRPWLHEERVHLPLIIRLPGATQAGRRVAALTQAVDLAPTMLDLHGVLPPEMHGSSLVPLLEGRTVAIRPYACAGLRGTEGAELCLRTPAWSFLLPIDQPERRKQLFVKPDDRFEVNDVAQHHPERVEQLEQTLRAFANATRLPGPLHFPPLPD